MAAAGNTSRIIRATTGPVPAAAGTDAAQWLAQQRTRLLPVPYFLVTFTVPEQLREPIRAAMKPWYGALLKESAGALQDLAGQPKHLGAELGPTALLQTWTRDLRYHPHVHLLVPGGGLTPNRLRWVRVSKPEFLLPQVKLAARFKGRLKAWLKQHEPELFPSARQGLVAQVGGGHPAGGQRRGGVKVSGRLSVPSAPARKPDWSAGMRRA